jgi:hypothetical protein
MKKGVSLHASTEHAKVRKNQKGGVLVTPDEIKVTR